MPVQFETFSQGKIDTLKSHLEATAAKGKPKSFEIWIDGLQVIPRTEEPAEFDNYEEYLTPESSQIKVVIYCTDKTNRNDKYIYSLKAKNPQEAIDLGIAGLPVKTFNSREIDNWRQKQVVKTEQNRAVGELRDELDELNELLDEKQAYIVELEQALKTAEANKNTIKGIDLGNVLAAGLEQLARNTTSYWKNVPGLAGIAEELEQDKSRNAHTPNTQDSEVSITKKAGEGDGIILTDQEKELLNFFKEMQRHFSQAEFEQVISILDFLSKDKTEIPVVLGHLKGEEEESE